jgi:cytochrome c oxidase cbb3-type subunit 1
LTYTFVESLKATYPYYAVRLGGGLLFLIGMFLMLYNVIRTIVPETRTEPLAAPAAA